MSTTENARTIAAGYDPETGAHLDAEIDQIMSRYPAGHERSALIPMLHLIQSVDGFVSPRGIALCAQKLGLTRSEVSAVATFYSQFRRHPVGEYHVGVCTNALCAVMGGDEVWRAVSEHTGLGNDETTRGPETLPTFRDNERLLAGFEDGRADEGIEAGEASLLGLRIARERGWSVPEEEAE